MENQNQNPNNPSQPDFLQFKEFPAQNLQQNQNNQEFFQNTNSSPYSNQMQQNLQNFQDFQNQMLQSYQYQPTQDNFSSYIPENIQNFPVFPSNKFQQYENVNNLFSFQQQQQQQFEQQMGQNTKQIQNFGEQKQRERSRSREKELFEQQTQNNVKNFKQMDFNQQNNPAYYGNNIQTINDDTKQQQTNNFSFLQNNTQFNDNNRDITNQNYVDNNIFQNETNNKPELPQFQQQQQQVKPPQMIMKEENLENPEISQKNQNNRNTSQNKISSEIIKEEYQQVVKNYKDQKIGKLPLGKITLERQSLLVPEEKIQINYYYKVQIKEYKSQSEQEPDQLFNKKPSSKKILEMYVVTKNKEKLVKINSTNSRALIYLNCYQVISILAQITKTSLGGDLCEVNLYVILNQQLIDSLPYQVEISDLKDSNQEKVFKLFHKFKLDIKKVLQEIQGVKIKQNSTMERGETKQDDSLQEYIPVDSQQQSQNENYEESKSQQQTEEKSTKKEFKLDPFAAIQEEEQIDINDLLFQSAPYFKNQLKYHQREGVSWLLYRENYYMHSQDPHQIQLQYLLNNFIEKNRVIHPYWQTYEVRNQKNIYYNLSSGQIQTKFPSIYDNTMIQGGILADEMGLGKTLMMLSAIVTNQREVGKLGTLVVLPVSLLQVWQSEMEKHLQPETIKYYLFYGKKMYINVDTENPDFTPYDIVLTTYESLSSFYKKNKEYMKNITMFQEPWKRIVLDEGHLINNINTLKTECVLKLNAQIKWIITGTPLQNKIKDLYPLISFLRIPFWSKRSHFQSIIEKSYEKDSRVSKIVYNILQPITIKRNKQSAGIIMPQKSIETVLVKFDQQEKELYQALQSKTIEKFEGFLASGNIPSMQMLTLILRLRQQCNHWQLLQSAEQLSQPEFRQTQIYDNIMEFYEIFYTRQQQLQQTQEQQQLCEDPSSSPNLLGELETTKSMQNIMPVEALSSQLNSLKENNQLDLCTVCQQNLQNRAIITKCLHSICVNCINQYQILQNNKFCPKCNTDISEYTDTKQFEIQDQFQIKASNDQVQPAKLKAVVQKILNIHTQFEGDKIIVFTQFLGMIDFIEQEVNRFQQDQPEEIKLKPLKLHGRQRQEQRCQILKEFETQKNRVLISSLRVGNVGLNLTCANHMLIVDNWWNPFTEMQAMFRIHRIGQTKNCFISKFIVKDSIEERIEEIKNKKMNMVNQTIGGTGGMNQDSSSDQLEQQYQSKLRIDDFKQLLGMK